MARNRARKYTEKKKVVVLCSARSTGRRSCGATCTMSVTRGSAGGGGCGGCAAAGGAVRAATYPRPVCSSEILIFHAPGHVVQERYFFVSIRHRHQRPPPIFRRRLPRGATSPARSGVSSCSGRTTAGGAVAGKTRGNISASRMHLGNIYGNIYF